MPRPALIIVQMRSQNGKYTKYRNMWIIRPQWKSIAKNHANTPSPPLFGIFCRIRLFCDSILSAWGQEQQNHPLIIHKTYDQEQRLTIFIKLIGVTRTYITYRHPVKITPFPSQCIIYRVHDVHDGRGGALRKRVECPKGIRLSNECLNHAWPIDQ